MILLAGLGFGDEGKGSIVDFLVELMNLKSVVRYNGGPQAAHYVVKNGRVHCFSQFGSGTFSPDVKTYISKYMLVDPYCLDVEEKALRKVGITDGYERLFIDNGCLVITPFQKIVGKIREVIFNRSSCGLGVGETVNDSNIWKDKFLRVEDLFDLSTLRCKLEFILKVKKDQAEQLSNQYDIEEVQLLLKMIDEVDLNFVAKEYNRIISKTNIGSFSSFNNDQIIFEGAQGFLLDPDYGFWPYVTKTKTTFDNAYKLIDSNNFKKVGVLRGYYTRHGDGPFVSEDKELTIKLRDPHNNFNRWQGEFRVGWFDSVATRYSLRVLGDLDVIFLTNIDRLIQFKDIKVCTAYEYCCKPLEDDIDRFFEYENISGKKIIRNIKLQNHSDLKSRNKLKNLLYGCKPIYTTIKNWNITKYVDFLKSEQIDPIRIGSIGPESTNKISL